MKVPVVEAVQPKQGVGGYRVEKKLGAGGFGQVYLAHREGAACALKFLNLERVGVATEVYGRMERGHLTPSVLNLRTLCRVLRLGADAALGPDRRETPEWTKEEPAAEDDPPRLRRLLRTLRRFDDRQLAAIGSVTRSYVWATEGEPETP